MDGNTIYMTEAGPLLSTGRRNEIGKIVAFDAKSSAVSDVAAPAPDSSSTSNGAAARRSSASHRETSHPDEASGRQNRNTGRLLRVDGDGGFSTAASGLDQPSSLEIIGTTAYVVTLGGEIWKIDNISGPPYGH